MNIYFGNLPAEHISNVATLGYYLTHSYIDGVSSWEVDPTKALELLDFTWTAQVTGMGKIELTIETPEGAVYPIVIIPYGRVDHGQETSD